MDAGVGCVGKQDELGVRILREPVLFLLRGIHLEALDIGIALIVSIIEDGGPGLVGIVLLDAQDILLVVVVQVEVRQVVVAVLQDDENLVVIEELTQQTSVFVVVQTVYVGVVPHLATA